VRKLTIPLLTGLLVLVGSSVRASAAIKGDYIEVRSADVYTGPCFANSEVGLTGNEAILAWRIEEGDWQGTSLNSLSIVAVVKANATLGDPYHNPYPAKSVLIVDERATSAQRQALEEFARSAAGRLLANVVRVESAPIKLEVAQGARPMAGSAKLVAGQFARIETRSLCAADHLCGNEFVYYPPLVQVAHAMPAFTLRDSFQGVGLDVVWNHVDKRSAFVGTFSF
jgi:hypothetical protein